MTSKSAKVLKILAVVSLLPVSGFGKVLTVGQKASLLNFPTLSKSVIEKSATAKPVASPPKLDNSLARDWALSNIGFFDLFTPLIQPLKKDTAPCSPKVVVAVVDTGIDYTHPDLMENLWVNQGEVGAWMPPAGQEETTACRDKSCNGIDDDGDGFADDVVGWDFVNNVALPWDVHGHGTHIAGIIAAKAGNGMGTVGVCPSVSIMALKYYDNTAIGYNNLQNTVKAFEFAIKHGADIINYSGGGAEPAFSEKNVVEMAQKKGVLLVAAAGNDGHNNDQSPYFPASYNLDNIISVASVTQENKLLPSSNYGQNSVHVAAPGLQILSTLPGGKYGTMSGTSQATAFVTGAAALLYSQYKESVAPEYKKVKAWLTDSAVPLTVTFAQNVKRQMVSGGLLQVAKAVQMQRLDLDKAAPKPIFEKKPLLAKKPIKKNLQ